MYKNENKGITLFHINFHIDVQSSCLHSPTYSILY